MGNTDLHLSHSRYTFTERWSHEQAAERLQGSPMWLCMARFKSNRHWANILTSLIKPLMNLEKHRKWSLVFQWAWAEMGDRWASKELRERTPKLVTNTLNVKHPSLVFIGTGLTELKGNTLTSFSQIHSESSQKSSASTQWVEHFGKWQKSERLIIWGQQLEKQQVNTTKWRKSRYFNSLAYPREL